MDATTTAGSAPTRRLGAEGWALVALTVLSIIGIGIADFSAGYGLRYWLMMVPVFAGVSIWAGWTRARASGQSVGAMVRQQVLHWAVLPFAAYFVYLLEATGRLNQEDAGLVALLAVALTTFLAGVHFDWRLALLGLLLCATALCAALVEEFFWLLLLPAIAAGAIMIFWHRWGR